METRNVSIAQRNPEVKRLRGECYFYGSLVVALGLLETVMIIGVFQNGMGLFNQLGCILAGFVIAMPLSKFFVDFAIHFWELDQMIRRLVDDKL